MPEAYSWIYHIDGIGNLCNRFRSYVFESDVIGTVNPAIVVDLNRNPEFEKLIWMSEIEIGRDFKKEILNGEKHDFHGILLANDYLGKRKISHAKLIEIKNRLDTYEGIKDLNKSLYERTEAEWSLLTGRKINSEHASGS